MPTRSALTIAAVTAVVYVAAAKLGFTMAFTADQVTLVWPPTGLALAALLLYGRQAWAGVFIGAFIANATAHETLPVAALHRDRQHARSHRRGLPASPLHRPRRLARSAAARARAGRLRRAPQHDDRRHRRRHEPLRQRHAAVGGVPPALVDVVARRRCRRDARGAGAADARRLAPAAARRSRGGGRRAADRAGVRRHRGLRQLVYRERAALHARIHGLPVSHLGGHPLRHRRRGHGERARVHHRRLGHGARLGAVRRRRGGRAPHAAADLHGDRRRHRAPARRRGLGARRIGAPAPDRTRDHAGAGGGLRCVQPR